MNLNITYQTLAKITNGVLYNASPREVLKEISFDTRTLTKGSCYLALKGRVYDGHAFLKVALKNGANFLIVEKGTSQKYAEILKDIAFMEVEDTLVALQEIAKFHRVQQTIKIAAITGSNGKSTTKQMLRAILNSVGQTCASEGNFNNQVGVPRSLLEISSKDKFGVFELGASHIGDIAEVACLARPDVAVLTNIAPSHLEFFKTIENIYKTKTEILNFLNPQGTVVFNGDDDYLKCIKTEYNFKMISFGFSAGNDIKIEDSPTFSFTYKGALFSTGLALERHNKLNAVAACGAALALGLFKEEIERGIESYVPMPLRLQKVHCSKTDFILDCYNANPASMEEGLNILATSASPKTAVLGDMCELGDSSVFYHEELAKKLASLGLENIFLIGQEMAVTAKKLKGLKVKNVKHSLNKQDFVTDISDIAKRGGTILFKGSRALNLEELFNLISKEK